MLLNTIGVGDLVGIKFQICRSGNSVHFMKVFEVIRAIRVLNSQERVIESIRERTGIQPVFSMYDAKKKGDIKRLVVFPHQVP